MYGEDLAFVHAVGFGNVAEAAAREVLTRFPRPAQVVDLGCGAGTLAAQLARHGHRVWGVDASADMVALARRKAPQAAFDVADAFAVRLPPCDAITLVGEVLNYALADQPLAAADGLFTRAHAALRPGGLLLFDCASTAKAPAHYTATRAGKGWRVEARIVAAGDRLQRTIDTWRLHADGERHTREVHAQRLVDPGWVTARLEAAGFDVEPMGGYDDLPFEEGWDAFAATRGQ